MKPEYKEAPGLSITFWEKSGGRFAMSHKDGLTAKQVEDLKSLRPGDKLIVYVNDKKGDTSPSHTLKLFIERNDSGGL